MPNWDLSRAHGRLMLAVTGDDTNSPWDEGLVRYSVKLTTKLLDLIKLYSVCPVSKISTFSDKRGVNVSIFMEVVKEDLSIMVDMPETEFEKVYVDFYAFAQGIKQRG
jgi:hypothetical protein